MAKSTSKLFQNEVPEGIKEDAMNLPEAPLSDEGAKESVDDVNAVKEHLPNMPVVNTPENDVQDINISAIKRKRFRINGDPNKILELNTSDLNIRTRLYTAYERLTNLMEKVGSVLSDIPDDAELDDSQENLIKDKLDEIDAQMKKEIDYIFDAPVSDICCEGGSMYDPFEGMFRYEHIIDALTKLYEENLNSEFNKMKRRVSNVTSKYTKKYHR